MSTTTPATLLGVPVHRMDDQDDQAALPTQSPVLHEAAAALVEGPGKTSSTREGKRKTVTDKPKVTATRKRRHMDDKLSQSGPPAGGSDAPAQPPRRAAANARREPQQPADEGTSLGELAHRGPQPRLSTSTAQRQNILSKVWAGVSTTSSWMTSSLYVVGLDRTARFGRYFDSFTNSKAMAALIYVLSGALTIVGIVLFMVLTVILGVAAAVIIGLVILTQDLYQAFVTVRSRTSHWFQRRSPQVEVVAATE